MKIASRVRRKIDAFFDSWRMIDLTYQNNQAKEHNVDKEVSRLGETA